MKLESDSCGHFPAIASTARVHPTAVLIGHVIVEDDVFIGPHAVLRADEPGEDGKVEPVVVSRQSNIQDGVIVHALGGTGVRIGSHTSIAHGAIVHGPCEIGKRCFVGFLSVVFRAKLADDVIVLHHAMVEGADIPASLVVPSGRIVQSASDVERLAPASNKDVTFAQNVSQSNVRLARSAHASPHMFKSPCVQSPGTREGRVPSRSRSTCE